MDPEYVKNLMARCRENILSGKWNGKIVVGQTRDALDMVDGGFATLEIPTEAVDILRAFGHGLPIEGGPQHYVVKLTERGLDVLRNAAPRVDQHISISGMEGEFKVIARHGDYVWFLHNKDEPDTAHISRVKVAV